MTQLSQLIDGASVQDLERAATPNARPAALPLLELREVTKTHDPGLGKRRRTVLDNVSLTLRARCTTALLGHNGAGKTTTIRMILGLIKPDHGKILFQGQAMTRHHRAAIGYMPEVNKLPMDSTCQEILRHQLRLYEVHTDSPALVVQTKLAEVGLGDHGRKRVAHLSKGMARRLAWAQATIHNPEFLILDEPFSGLDPLARHEMQGWMRDLKAAGKGMLLCTHEFWTVQDLCDDLYILNRGKMVYTTATSGLSQVKNVPCSLQVRDTTLSKLLALAGAHGLPPWAHAETGENAVRLVFDSNEHGERWLHALVSRGHSITRFGPDEQYYESTLMTYFRT